jgi:hypothetical protein
MYKHGASAWVKAQSIGGSCSCGEAGFRDLCQTRFQVLLPSYNAFRGGLSLKAEFFYGPINYLMIKITSFFLHMYSSNSFSTTCHNPMVSLRNEHF